MQKAPLPAKRFLALKTILFTKKTRKNMEVFVKNPYFYI